MGAKIQTKNDTVNNFGVFFCIDQFRKSGLAVVIDNTLGINGVFAKHGYLESVETIILPKI